MIVRIFVQFYANCASRYQKSASLPQFIVSIIVKQNSDLGATEILALPPLINNSKIRTNKAQIGFIFSISKFAVGLLSLIHISEPTRPY